MAGFPSATKVYHKTTYASLDPTRPELSAKGKTIVVTGGGTGIGAEIAKYFAKAGASHIAILGRREQPLLDTKAELEAEAKTAGTRIFAIPTDVTEESEVQTAFAEIAGENNGKIDVLVSNAAVMGTKGSVENLATEDFMFAIVANLKANFNVAKTFLKYASKDAVVIETNSGAAHLSIAPGMSSYCVAKAATARFYNSLAFEHPELSIFSVQPGIIKTGISRAREAGDETKKEEGTSAISQFDDVSLPASFMVWLASPEARFLKGKFLWANWDVEELKARANEIENGPLLSIGLVGWPFA